MPPKIGIPKHITNKIERELKGINNPVTLASQFVVLLKTCGQGNIAVYLAGFKELYGGFTYYQGVKSLILDEVRVTGIIDLSDASEML